MSSSRGVPVQRNTLILDWDGTLTRTSTLGLIASIRPDAPALDSFTEAYEADLARHAAQWPGQRCTDADEEAWSASLADIEVDSIRRLEEAGIWKGVTGPPLRHESQETRSATTRAEVLDVETHAQEAVASGKVQLRPGAAALIQHFVRRHEAVLVISVSWSGSWIAACLTALGIRASSAAAVPKGTHVDADVLVIANEIDPAGSGRLSRGYAYIGGSELTFDGSGTTGLWTAKDKLDMALTWSMTLGKGTRIVCLGDSLTDLQMLQAADVGIVVVDEERTPEQRELQETLQRIQWQVHDIEDPQKAGGGVEMLARVTGDLNPVLKYIYSSNS